MFVRLQSFVKHPLKWHTLEWRQPRSFSTSTVRFASKNPEYHDGHPIGTLKAHTSSIFLHARQPPSEFPKAGPCTAVSSALQLRAKGWGALGVTFCWQEQFASEEWFHTDRQPMTVYSENGRLDIDDVNLDNMEEVENKVEKFLVMDATTTVPLNANDESTVDVYVCTHAARDCRCGERGQQVYDALVRTVKEDEVMNPVATRIKIAATGHVGGHQYAANVIVFPPGDWFGCMKPEDAPWLVRRLYRDLELKSLDLHGLPISSAHWRGRMGWSKEETTDLYHRHVRPPE